MGRDIRMFVYGTLMLGETHHDVLSGARYLGRALTTRRYGLVDLGDWPGLLLAGGQSISGELFEVPHAMVPMVDAFEEVPDVFIRQSVTLESSGSAQAYFVRHAPADAEPILSGDWRLHRRSRG